MEATVIQPPTVEMMVREAGRSIASNATIHQIMGAADRVLKRYGMEGVHYVGVRAGVADGLIQIRNHPNQNKS